MPVAPNHYVPVINLTRIDGLYVHNKRQCLADSFVCAHTPNDNNFSLSHKLQLNQLKKTDVCCLSTRWLLSDLNLFAICAQNRKLVNVKSQHIKHIKLKTIKVFLSSNRFLAVRFFFFFFVVALFVRAFCCVFLCGFYAIQHEKQSGGMQFRNPAIIIAHHPIVFDKRQPSRFILCPKGTKRYRTERSHPFHIIYSSNIAFNGML